MKTDLTLKRMTKGAFDQYLDYGIAEYAKDKMRSLGIDQDQALLLSRQSMEQGLPQGQLTPDNYLYTVFDASGADIGILWIAVQENWGKTTVFIYDIEIKIAYRRRGYGTALMTKVEALAQTFKAQQVALHVFAHNKSAADLYIRLGYQTTDISMSKPIC